MEKPYKIVALDLDGTLLDERGEITENNLCALQRAREAGIIVLIATGRMLVSALPYYEKLKLKAPIITYNGALIKDVSADKIMAHHPVSLKQARSIIRDTQQKGLHLNLYLDDRLFVKEHTPESRGYEKDTGTQARAVGSLLDFLDRPPTKLLVIERDRDRFVRLLQYYQKQFGSELKITESKKHYLEFGDLRATKGLALSSAADYLGVDCRQVMAVGDALNDLSMIKWAGCGVTVKGASSQIKEEADFIIPDPENDGIAYLIDRYILASHSRE